MAAFVAGSFHQYLCGSLSELAELARLTHMLAHPVHLAGRMRKRGPARCWELGILVLARAGLVVRSFSCPTGREHQQKPRTCRLVGGPCGGQHAVVRVVAHTRPHHTESSGEEQEAWGQAKHAALAASTPD